MEYNVFVTNDCNMNCTYCSVLLDNKKTGMPLDMQYDAKDLRKFVDATQKANKDDFATIIFFGGEPTLDFDGMQKIIQEFENVRGYEVNFILHTNGLLLGQLPDKILKKLDVIYISINYQKVYTNGHISDYFINMVSNINQVKAKQKQIVIMGRLTITKDASLYTQCALLGNIFDYVYWQMDNRKEMDGIEEYKVQYKKDISLLFDYWLSFLRQRTILYYVPFLGIIRNYIDNGPPPKYYYCGYGNYSIFVQTNGTCFACCEAVESSGHKIGDIYNGIKFTNMSLERTRCSDCPHVKLCGGRCGRMHKDFDSVRINHFCELNIFTFNLIKNAMPEIKMMMQTNCEFYKAIHDYHLEYTELIP